MILFIFQRATLAEKEVTTLKEQLSGNNASNNCENKDTSNMDRHGYEVELATKDKEVSPQISFYKQNKTLRCNFLLSSS